MFGIGQIGSPMLMSTWNASLAVARVPVAVTRTPAYASSSRIVSERVFVGVKRHAIVNGRLEDFVDDGFDVRRVV
jgi:hypothetical protein